jgi:hypothetical protein
VLDGARVDNVALALCRTVLTLERVAARRLLVLKNQAIVGSNPEQKSWKR